MRISGKRNGELLADGTWEIPGEPIVEIVNEPQSIFSKILLSAIINVSHGKKSKVLNAPIRYRIDDDKITFIILSDPSTTMEDFIRIEEFHVQGDTLYFNLTEKEKEFLARKDKIKKIISNFKQL